MRLADATEFATHVDSAGRLDLGAVIRFVVVGKSVSVKDADEVLHGFLWILSLAVWRIGFRQGRCAGLPSRPFTAHVHPQSPINGLFTPRR